MHRNLFFLSLFLFSFTGSRAQTGPWNPAGADMSWPRTLLDTSEIDSVRAWLSHPKLLPLYDKMTDYIFFGAPPSVMLSTDPERRMGGHAAKNAAFHYLMGMRVTSAGTLVPHSPAGLDSLRDWSIAYLNVMNTNVEASPNWDPWLWRSNELIENLCAYDLLKGAGVPDSLLATARTLLLTYSKNLYTETMKDFFGLAFWPTHINNHGLRSAGALAMAGIVLNDATGPTDAEQASRWFHTGMFHIDNILFRDAGRQSEPGYAAGYAEGPHYLRFGMKHVIPVIQAAHNVLPDTILPIMFDGSTRNIRHPWYDPNMFHLFDWVMNILQPDGRVPAIEDSFVDVGYPEMAVMRNPDYAPRWNGNLSHLAWNQTWSLHEQLEHSTDDLKADYICARTFPGTESRLPFYVNPESGDVVLRSSWDTSAVYLHVMAKNGLRRTSARGHNQVDETSFLLYAFGEVLAMDPGYINYSNRELVDEADQHNMILVDGLGPPGPSFTLANGADAFADYGFEHGGLQFARVHSAYQSANIQRDYYLVRGEYVLDADVVSAAAAHTYSWRCHGMGQEGGDSASGTFVFTPFAGGTWTKNLVNLSVQVTEPTGVSISRETDIHEFTYVITDTHTTLNADKAASANAHFLAAMVPWLTDTPFIQIRTTTSAYNYLMVQSGGYADFLAANDTIEPLGTPLLSGVGAPGSLHFFFSADTLGAWSQYFVHAGNTITYNGASLYEADTILDFGLWKKDDFNYEGYAGAAATVTIPVGFVPLSVNGVGVGSWIYDAGLGAVIVTFSGPGKFTIHNTVVVAIAQPERLPGVWVFPNPATDILWLDVAAEKRAQVTQVRLLDAAGRVVAEKQNPKEFPLQFQVQNLPAGTYFAELLLTSGEKRGAKALVR